MPVQGEVIVVIGAAVNCSRCLPVICGGRGAVLGFATANPRGVAVFQDEVLSGVKEHTALPYICFRRLGNVGDGAKKDCCLL